MPRGVYWLNPFDIQVTNQPTDYGILINIPMGSNEISQIYVSHPNGYMYTRAGNNSGWNGTDSLIWYAATNGYENKT